jgi:integrase
VLKDGDELLSPIGSKAAAIDRYLRIRGAHAQAPTSPRLWLGMRGHDTAHMTAHMTARGIRGMLDRRGRQAGIEGVHPHRFRGTAAHELLKAGASDGDVQHILGWKTRTMVDYYAGDLARERARDTRGVGKTGTTRYIDHVRPGQLLALR